jgi:agmatinase
LRNFGDITKPYCSWPGAKFVIVPAPCDITTSYIRGTGNGPAAIIAASANMELYDETLKIEPYKAGIHTSSPIKNKNLKKFLELLERRTLKILSEKKIPIILGGEHTVSLGSVKALKKFYRNFTVVHIDAHADLRDKYLGKKYSHASVARRIKEITSLTQIGIRSLSQPEAGYIKREKIPCWFANDIKDKRWIKKMLKGLSEHVYISLDLDALDPSIMPSVGTPEPGGLGWENLLEIIKTICFNRKTIGLDMVELSPIKGLISPDFLAARLLYRIIGFITKASHLSAVAGRSFCLRGT